MVVVSHLFLFYGKISGADVTWYESHLPLFGTIYFPIAPFHIYLQNRIREILPSETPTPSLFLPSSLSGHALDRLVIVSSMHCCTSTSILSTSSSSRGLTGLTPGISHLEGGFTLRCLQRLSRPGLATLPCAWRRNRSTSGQSIPVLSY